MKNVESTANGLLLPAEIYSLQLESVNGIYFTRREIDIIACILSGRSTKKIALFLSISSRTVENHIRNIMLKLGCRTQEGIIDFIEKSGKFTAIKKYYSSLLIQDIFEKILTKISSHPASACLIVYSKEEKKTVPLINQLKSHLELAGIIVLIESSTTNYTEVNLINKIDSHKIDTVIYCLPESDPNRINFKECNYKSEKLFALKYIEFNYHENYYFTVLEILTKLLPGFPLENAIQAFKKEYESLYEPVSIINKPNTIKVNPLETEKHSKNKILMNLKNKKKWVYAACTLSLMPFFAWLLTYNIQSHEYNATQKSKFNNGNVVDANNNNITDFALQPNPAITLNWNLPPQHHQFIGREDLLETIDKVFRPSTQQTMSEVNQSKTKHEHAPLAISVLAGLGGVGKTQLALEYIHHSKHPYKLKSWFSAENLEQLKQQYIEFAKFLGYKEQKMEINMALAYIKKTLMDYKDWILVYDNVNNYDELKDYLPEGNGNIILTTRQRNWPSTFQIINIDVMTEAESIELIKSLTKNEITKNEMTNAKELVNTLGYLPLALAQAGSYIQQNSISIQEYLELYKKHESDLLLDTAAPEGTNSLPVEITWNITLDAIIKDPYIDEKQSALALHLLSVCSYLAPEEIPRTFLLSWLKEAHPELPSPELILTKLIGKLWQYSMISKNSNGDITIHPLVQAVLRHQHKQALTKKDSHYPKLTLIWYDVLLKSIHTEFHRSTTPLENEARKRALHPHLQWLLKNYEILWNKESARSHIGDVICDIGDITFDQMFNTKVAKLYYERGLPLQKQLYGENHPQIAYTLRNLGTVYRKLGDYQKAKVLFEQALEIQEHHYGQNHPNIAPILTSLGFAHRLFGNFEEANIFLKRALAIQEENYGKDHPEVAIILECLGIVDYKMEYYDQAKLKFERALKILESHYKTDHPTIGYVLRNLGHTYAISGNPKSAMDLLEKALKNQRRYCNDNSPEIAFTLRDLGLAYGLNGNYKQGTEALEHALRVQEDIYGKNHPEVAFTLNYLGIVYAKQKDYKKAEDLVTRAVLIQEKFYGKEHLETKKTLKTLKDITLKVN